MYTVELRSNAWEGVYYIHQGAGPGEVWPVGLVAGSDLLTADVAKRAVYEERGAAVAEAKEVANAVDTKELAGLSDVCWQIVKERPAEPNYLRIAKVTGS